MKSKPFFLAILLSLYSIAIIAQREVVNAKKCKASNANLEVFSKNPEARMAYEKFNDFTRNYIKSNAFAQKAGETYVIPVVFHIYGEVQHGKTVTYEKIKTALDILNKDFNGLNDDWNTIDPFFDSRKATLSIRFALAKIDPNGVTTNGVVFYPVASGMGNYSSPIVARDGWDNYKYMNVYITGDLYGDGVSNNSGVAWYPNATMSDQNIARVVYNGQYLHGNTDKEFASILTHEFGHWLNLIHTFEGGCNDPNGDFVGDTPKEDTDSGDDGCQIGASDCGNLINYENYMGYDSNAGCAKMYTRGQADRMLAALEHSTRRPLWQSDNLAATGVAVDGASFLVSNTKIEEEISNNGTVSNETNEIEISDGSFALSSGTMIEGTHFTSNLPQGYSASITVLNNRTLRVQFSGITNNHAVSNNTTGSITFRNAAILGGTVTLATDKVTYQFSFLDPYKIVYVNNNDLTVSSSNTWEPLTDDFLPDLGGVLGNFSGLFYNASGHPSNNPAIQFETYQEAMITIGNTRNIAIVPANTIIDDSSSWVNGGSYPNLLDIRTDSHRTWDGQTGYAGFRFTKDGRQHYGWYQFRVSTNGSSATLLDYAYNTKPFEGIKAGSQGGDPTCDDGIQNGNETGVDCGGSCDPCSAIAYCSASTTQNTLHITNVKFGSIDNTTSHMPYSNYTNLSANLTAGQQTALTVELNNDHWTYNAVGVWIDWNSNGDFTDSGENVYSRYAAGPYTSNIIPPISAITNTNLRMRVRVGYGSESKITPCGIDTYIGEVEDYTIRIEGVSAPTCTDGIQNGDETGVDCGGSCAPCNTNAGIVYVDIPDETVTSSNTWEFFRIEEGDNRDYGAWYTNGSVRLVTYNKDVVCVGTTNNIAFLGENIGIDGSSNFVAESHSYIVSSSTYTNWKGKTGYVGFTFNIDGNKHYGWFHINVSSNGLSYTILDYAYQTLPGATIYTGINGASGKDFDDNIESLVKLGPNPFENTFEIDLGLLKANKICIEVYDIYGKKIVRKEYATNPNKVFLGERLLAKGIYLVKIKTQDTTIVQKVVKN